jgi:hypothetical protein
VPKRIAFTLAVAVSVLITSACTQHSAPTVAVPTPTPVRTSAPPRAPVAWTVPQPAPIKDEFLLYNPLYRSGQVTAVSCSLPTAKLSNQQALIRYATAFVTCLNRSWAPLITRAGFDFVPPSAVLPAKPGATTACGAMDKDAFGMYCQNDRGIYFNWPEYVVKESSGQEEGRAWVQWLIGHEYGHHVQWLTGMADDYGVRYEAANGAAAEKVEENRNEMQAHCLAAAFFGPNRKTFHLHGERLSHYGHPGYDRTEADLVNFDHWLRQAFSKGPAGCVTWAAPASTVTGV